MRTAIRQNYRSQTLTTFQYWRCNLSIIPKPRSGQIVLTLIAALVVPLAASGAKTQQVDYTPYTKFRQHDGSGETSWKVSNPSVSGDWFNVDFGGMVTGVTAAAIGIDTFDTSMTGGSWAVVGLYSSSTNGAPDIIGGSIATTTNAVVNAGDDLSSVQGYGIPCTTLGSDVHVAVNFNAGDTNLWLAADTNGAIANTSYFTSSSYSTGQIPFTLNWVMEIGGFAPGSDGTLLVNGANSAAITQGDNACLTFTGCDSGVRGALYLTSPVFFGPLLPPPLTVTGGILGGPCDNQWTLCSQTDCNTPTGGPSGLATFYLDPCDLKANGLPRAKVSTTGLLNINDGPDDLVSESQAVYLPQIPPDFYDRLFVPVGHSELIRNASTVQIQPPDHPQNPYPYPETFSLCFNSSTGDYTASFDAEGTFHLLVDGLFTTVFVGTQVAEMKGMQGKTGCTETFNVSEANDREVLLVLTNTMFDDNGAVANGKDYVQCDLEQTAVEVTDVTSAVAAVCTHVQNHGKLDKLTILEHGGMGLISIGGGQHSQGIDGTKIIGKDSANAKVGAFQEFVDGMKDKFNPDAELCLVGCHVGEGTAGQNLVNCLASEIGGGITVKAKKGAVSFPLAWYLLDRYASSSGEKGWAENQ